jgi:hypothetical protein
MIFSRREFNRLPHITRVANPYEQPPAPLIPQTTASARDSRLPSEEWRVTFEKRFKNFRKVWLSLTSVWNMAKRLTAYRTSLSRPHLLALPLPTADASLCQTGRSVSTGGRSFRASPNRTGTRRSGQRSTASVGASTDATAGETASSQQRMGGYPSIHRHHHLLLLLRRARPQAVDQRNCQVRCHKTMICKVMLPLREARSLRPSHFLYQSRLRCPHYRCHC